MFFFLGVITLGCCVITSFPPSQRYSSCKWTGARSVRAFRNFDFCFSTSSSIGGRDQSSQPPLSSQIDISTNVKTPHSFSQSLRRSIPSTISRGGFPMMLSFHRSVLFPLPGILYSLDLKKSWIFLHKFQVTDPF